MGKGIYHDLHYIYARLNESYFSSKIDAAIMWGKWGPSRTSLRSIRLGSYDSKRRLITIHPAMDQACVPRLCIERIVYHEMLHQKHPAKKAVGGRRMIHTQIFRDDEKKFLSGSIADEWFKFNLDRILRHRPAHLKSRLNVS